MTVTVAARSQALQRITARPTFNRWLIPPAALAVHLCIGQAYATSVYKSSLVEHFQTSQTAIGVIFSIAIVMLGLSAAFFGTWVDRYGPRRAMIVSAICWALGFFVGALGIATGQLWLVYVGYGGIGGIGLGVGYISPVSTLIKWFPDRPGLATGLAIMGFGGGAMIASPISAWLLGVYDPDLSDGVASGDAVMKLFLTLGVAYLVLMLFGAWIVRVPAPGWTPKNFDPSSVKSKPMVTTAHVSANEALRTPQFWCLWIALFCNVTAGIGILEQAAPMIQDFFRNPDTNVSLITASAAAGFVGVLSLLNMGGRFAWSTVSDYIGRKNIYVLYLGGGIVLYLLLTFFGASAIWLFIALTGIILSFYGGGFSTAPAYLRDLFGTYQVGAIHGRLLTAWSAAGVAGPLIINGVLDAQGTPGELTGTDYRPALLTMVGILVVGLIANLFIRNVKEKHHVDPALVPSGATTEAELEAGARIATKARVPVWLAWAIVAIPLIYGVSQTFMNALKLFT